MGQFLLFAGLNVHIQPALKMMGQLWVKFNIKPTFGHSLVFAGIADICEAASPLFKFSFLLYIDAGIFHYIRVGKESYYT